MMSVASMCASVGRRLARYSGLRRAVRDEQGSVAVEFGFIAVPFIGLLFAIIEVCMVFFSSQLLEKATQDASRKILTGQAQKANFTQAQFKQEICNHLIILFDCQGGVFIDVKNYPAFANVNIADPVVNGNFVNNFSYQPGNAGDIVVVRVYYLWQLFLPTFGLNLSNVGGNKKLLAATMAFRNEPF